VRLTLEFEDAAAGLRRKAITEGLPISDWRWMELGRVWPVRVRLARELERALEPLVGGTQAGPPHDEHAGQRDQYQAGHGGCADAG